MGHRLWGHEEAATRQTIRDAVAGFIATALWAGVEYDEEGNSGASLEATYSQCDIDDEVIQQIEEEVYDFLILCWEEDKDLSGIEPGQFGHDFYLTRNRHGAGFWDRGLGELGDWLTEMSHPYGEFDLYVGDDGKLYA